MKIRLGTLKSDFKQALRLNQILGIRMGGGVGVALW